VTDANGCGQLSLRKAGSLARQPDSVANLHGWKGATMPTDPGEAF
jgi:hypothetical protein